MDLNALSRWESIAEDMESMNAAPAAGSPPPARPPPISSSPSEGALLSPPLAAAAAARTAHAAAALPAGRRLTPPSAAARIPRLPSLGSIKETTAGSSPPSAASVAAPPARSAASSTPASASLPSSPVSVTRAAVAVPPRGAAGAELLHLYDSFDQLPAAAATAGAEQQRLDRQESREERMEDGEQPAAASSSSLSSSSSSPSAASSVWLYRAFRRFAKGLTVGFVGKSLLALLGLCIRCRFSLRRLVALPFLAQALAGEPVAYGLFLGSLLAAVQLVQDGAAAQLPATARRAAAGALGSLALYWLPVSHRGSVCLFFVCRALEVCCRFIGRRYCSRLPAALLQHTDSAVFCLSSAEICWAALYRTAALEPSYMAFLNAHSGKSTQSQLPLVAQLHGACNPHQPPFTAALREMDRERGRRRLPPLQLTQPFLLCEILHPDSACVPAFLAFFTQVAGARGRQRAETRSVMAVRQHARH